MAETWEVERVRRVREIWKDRYPIEKRTEASVLSFNDWLDRHRTELLDTEDGGSLENLKNDLKGFWND